MFEYLAEKIYPFIEKRWKNALGESVKDLVVKLTPDDIYILLLPQEEFDAESVNLISEFLKEKDVLKNSAVIASKGATLAVLKGRVENGTD